VKRSRQFCPVVCPLEGRAALSLSLSAFVHSVLPFIPESTPHLVLTPGQRAAHVAKVQEHHALVVAQRAARKAHIAMIRAEAASHPRAVIA
jgi:hypothetical protein